MIKRAKLNLHPSIIESLPVVFRRCTFSGNHRNCDCRIEKTFQFLREWATCAGINPAELIQVGVPVFQESVLNSYTCCLEYPLPYLDEFADVSLGELPGGKYMVTRREMIPHSIDLEIWNLMQNQLRQDGIAPDPRRPVYEIFHPHGAIDYCVAVLD
jgi:DNA gyrase inhibitor GyrI